MRMAARSRPIRLSRLRAALELPSVERPVPSLRSFRSLALDMPKPVPRHLRARHLSLPVVDPAPPPAKRHLLSPRLSPAWLMAPLVGGYLPPPLRRSTLAERPPGVAVGQQQAPRSRQPVVVSASATDWLPRHRLLFVPVLADPTARARALRRRLSVPSGTVLPSRLVGVARTLRSLSCRALGPFRSSVSRPLSMWAEAPRLSRVLARSASLASPRPSRLAPRLLA